MQNDDCEMDLAKDTQLVSVNPCSEHSAQIALLFFFFFNNFYLFLALCCCIGFSLVLESGGCSLVVMRGLLTVVAFLVEQGTLEHRLSSCGTWA